MSNKMEKVYDPKQYEDSTYAKWEEAGYFNPDRLPGERTEAYSISLPPPNATGTLHLGHAMYVLQDIMVRHARMNGKKALWLPGTDHAGIATQSKVEDILFKEEGKTRHEIGREALNERIDRFVAGSKATIRNQLRKMGFSLDWSRERFTLEPAMVEQVQLMFMRMAKDGLVYRGDRIVNWDPNLQTTIADDEQEYKEEKAPFYYFQYGPFVIGTARPETKFGDKYVVMHPDDERYTQYKHGQEIELEWINGPITATIIKDQAADPEFGSGAMTITPWHDATDFGIAQRHDLDREQIIDLDGTLLPIAGEFAGLPIAEAREKIVDKLREKGLLVRVDEDYVHNVAVSYRGGGIIEPQIMKQWFVAVDKPVVDWNGKKMSLKEVALTVVRSGDIEIVPERFNKTYFSWIENLHDWCISRQLWYGHRIPAWYAKEDTERIKPVVQLESPGEGYTQDEDVLDTWFSSGMWTFSTHDWHKNFDFEKMEAKPGTDLATFHPTEVLETGYDIIFFWVARMILMTTYGMGEIPFKKVYLHGLVRDRKGAKMSKSKGNGIDPLDMKEAYGADAVRLSLVIGTTAGNDSRLYEEKIAGYRNFVNKLWNVSRFIMMNEPASGEGSVADRWIISRLHTLIAEVNADFARDQYGPAGDRMYNFLWHEFADWYIEMSKIEELGSVKQREVLHTMLRLLHPMIPFVTEVLAEKTGLVSGDEQLIVMSWPKADAALVDEALNKRMETLQELISGVRSLRKQYKVRPGAWLEVLGEGFSDEEQLIIGRLARVTFVREREYTTSTSAVSGSDKIIIPLDGVIDTDAEKKRIQGEIDQLEKYLKSVAGKLSNEGFVKNAPPEVIEQTKRLQGERQAELAHLKEALDSLK